jgi:hypothetical protein
MREPHETGSASRLRRMRRAVAAAVIVMVVASGCVTQKAPGSDYVEDVGNDFQNNDYFNPP